MSLLHKVKRSFLLSTLFVTICSLCLLSNSKSVLAAVKVPPSRKTALVKIIGSIVAQCTHGDPYDKTVYTAALDYPSFTNAEYNLGAKVLGLPDSKTCSQDIATKAFDYLDNEFGYSNKLSDFINKVYPDGMAGFYYDYMLTLNYKSDDHDKNRRAQSNANINVFNFQCINKENLNEDCSFSIDDSVRAIGINYLRNGASSSYLEYVVSVDEGAIHSNIYANDGEPNRWAALSNLFIMRYGTGFNDGTLDISGSPGSVELDSESVYTAAEKYWIKIIAIENDTTINWNEDKDVKTFKCLRFDNEKKRYAESKCSTPNERRNKQLKIFRVNQASNGGSFGEIDPEWRTLMRPVLIFDNQTQESRYKKYIDLISDEEYEAAKKEIDDLIKEDEDEYAAGAEHDCLHSQDTDNPGYNVWKDRFKRELYPEYYASHGSDWRPDELKLKILNAFNEAVEEVEKDLQNEERNPYKQKIPYFVGNDYFSGTDTFTWTYRANEPFVITKKDGKSRCLATKIYEPEITAKYQEKIKKIEDEYKEDEKENVLKKYRQKCKDILIEWRTKLYEANGIVAADDGNLYDEAREKADLIEKTFRNTIGADYTNTAEGVNLIFKDPGQHYTITHFPDGARKGTPSIETGDADSEYGKCMVCSYLDEVEKVLVYNGLVVPTGECKSPTHTDLQTPISFIIPTPTDPDIPTYTPTPVGPGTPTDPTATTYEPDTCYAESGVLGWVICPLIKAASGIGEHLWEQIEQNHLKVPASTLFMENADGAAGIRIAWEIVRDFANIVFVVVFLVVIFSQITGYGIDNYGIKKILPKLIMMIILVNLSYDICRVVIDFSNIVGMSVNNFLTDIASKVQNASSFAGADGRTYNIGDYSGMIAVTMLIGGAMVLFTMLKWGSPGGGIAAIGLFVLGIVIVIVIAMLSLYLTLAIRDGAIVMGVTVAPAAIACNVLPNTQSLFKKWLNLMKAILVLYPICGFTVGAGKLAGAILASTGIESMRLAAGIVQVAPYFFIPSLLKKSMAGMGNIGAKLMGLGRMAGRRASRGATGAIRNSERFKNWNEAKATDAGIKRAEKALKRKKHLIFGKSLNDRLAATANGGTLTDKEARRIAALKKQQAQLEAKKAEIAQWSTLGYAEGQKAKQDIDRGIETEAAAAFGLNGIQDGSLSVGAGVLQDNYRQQKKNALAAQLGQQTVKRQPVSAQTAAKNAQDKENAELQSTLEAAYMLNQPKDTVKALNAFDGKLDAIGAVQHMNAGINALANTDNEEEAQIQLQRFSAQIAKAWGEAKLGGRTAEADKYREMMNQLAENAAKSKISGVAAWGKMTKATKYQGMMKTYDDFILSKAGGIGIDGKPTDDASFTLQGFASKSNNKFADIDKDTYSYANDRADKDPKALDAITGRQAFYDLVNQQKAKGITSATAFANRAINREEDGKAYINSSYLDGVGATAQDLIKIVKTDEGVKGLKVFLDANNAGFNESVKAGVRTIMGSDDLKSRITSTELATLQNAVGIVSNEDADAVVKKQQQQQTQQTQQQAQPQPQQQTPQPAPAAYQPPYQSMTNGSSYFNQPPVVQPVQTATPVTPTSPQVIVQNTGTANSTQSADLTKLTNSVANAMEEVTARVRTMSDNVQGKLNGVSNALNNQSNNNQNNNGNNSGNNGNNNNQNDNNSGYGFNGGTGI